MKTLERTIHADGADLHVEERGAGEPLLLLHGMTGTGGDWRHVFDLDALAATFRVVMPDARGHGRSTDPDGAFSFARYGRDVLAILDALGIEQTAAVGVSLGAKTLLHTATQAPSRIRAMVLVSATPRFPEATRALFRAAAALPRSPEEWTRMRALHVQGDAQIARLFSLPAGFGEDPMDFTAETLGAITARTLVVTGDRDPFYPVELAVELYRGIPNASLWVVPDALHVPIFLGQRESFVREALRFLT